MKKYIFDLYDVVIIDSGNFRGEFGEIRDVTTQNGNTLYGLKLKGIDALLYFSSIELDK